MELKDEKDPLKIQCFDPATGYSLGTVPVMSHKEIIEIVEKFVSYAYSFLSFVAAMLFIGTNWSQ